MPLTRALFCPGLNSTSSPTFNLPPNKVPVTTVPNPEIVKDLSIDIIACPWLKLFLTDDKTWSNSEVNSFKPSPETIETGIIFDPENDVSINNSSISNEDNWRISSSTKSVFVKTTIHFLTCSKSNIDKCSIVWGITDSSAETISKAKSIEPTPVSILLTKLSWPGTSIMLTSLPLGNSIQAKPKSIVRPLFFSSENLSGSIPVSDRTRDDLPWSTWPAVPITNMINSPLVWHFGIAR